MVNPSWFGDGTTQQAPQQDALAQEVLKYDDSRMNKRRIGSAEFRAGLRDQIVEKERSTKEQRQHDREIWEMRLQQEKYEMKLDELKIREKTTSQKSHLRDGLAEQLQLKQRLKQQEREEAMRFHQQQQDSLAEWKRQQDDIAEKKRREMQEQQRLRKQQIDELEARKKTARLRRQEEELSDMGRMTAMLDKQEDARISFLAKIGSPSARKQQQQQQARGTTPFDFQQGPPQSARSQAFDFAPPAPAPMQSSSGMRASEEEAQAMGFYAGVQEQEIDVVAAREKNRQVTNMLFLQMQDKEARRRAEKEAELQYAAKIQAEIQAARDAELAQQRAAREKNMVYKQYLKEQIQEKQQLRTRPTVW